MLDDPERLGEEEVLALSYFNYCQINPGLKFQEWDEESPYLQNMLEKINGLVNERIKKDTKKK